MDTDKTRALFAPLIQRPVLTDQLLNRPPFKFLHDIVSEVIKSTGYSDGLFTVDELDSTKASSSRDSKIAFLQKLIDLLNINGELDDLKPAKIVAGKEPELTNILLQSLAIEAAAYKQQQKEKKTTTKSKSSKSSSKEKAEKSKERDSSKSRSKTTSKLKTKDEKEEKVKVPEESSKVKKAKNEEQVILETKSRSKEKKSSTSKEKTSKDSTLKENKERKKKRSDSISKSGTKVSTNEVTASASPILSTQQQISQPHTELFYNSSLPNTGRTHQEESQAVELLKEEMIQELQRKQERKVKGTIFQKDLFWQKIVVLNLLKLLIQHLICLHLSLLDLAQQLDDPKQR
uniref:TRAF3-interacting protein 1 n=1 Tax=Meloidogyne enterolobii TaxID=390850 RepID=A0A6V7XTK6_MELEN|nr:unnamed protein product [Meloidogyne enterolobii]